LGFAQQTGEHWTDAFLHRIRGEILLKRDPANTAPAEEAFLTAITIAQQQKARTFELRAAMSMARLWRDQRKRQQATIFSLRSTAGSRRPRSCSTSWRTEGACGSRWLVWNVRLWAGCCPHNRDAHRVAACPADLW